MDGESEDPKKKGDGEPEEDAEFTIRELPDLRRLRKTYLRCGDKFIAFDSTDSPLPNNGEEDFGLERSTQEEALEFLRQLTDAADAGPDDLTEFLEDE